MSVDYSYYKSMEPFWGVWKIEEFIGEGAFGKVFRIVREDFGREYRSALKIISVPQSESEWEAVRMDGMDEPSTTAYFQDFVRSIIDETALMSDLRAQGNIVHYEDHAVIEHSDGHGWDILIRMELLTPFIKTIDTQYSMSHKDVIKFGTDICRALEYCHSKNIIHRDIKPENIFVSQSGDYKLGDFGIARTIEKTAGLLSKKGTYTYMAPEVYMGKEYNESVDIYSLGMVLYRLLNRNRAAFLPPYPEIIKHSDKEASINRRMSGERIPLPVDAQDALGNVILKACAYDPKDRYHSAEEFRKALENAQEASAESYYFNPEDEEKTTSMFPGVQNNVRNFNVQNSSGYSMPQTYQPVNQPMYQPVNQQMDRSMDQPMYQPMAQPVDTSVNRSAAQTADQQPYQYTGYMPPPDSDYYQAGTAVPQGKNNNWKKIVIGIFIAVACITICAVCIWNSKVLRGTYTSESGVYSVEFNADGTCTWRQNGLDFYGTYYKEDSAWILDMKGHDGYRDTTFNAQKTKGGLMIKGGVVNDELFIK